MSAYFVVEVKEIHDPEAYTEYRQQVMDTLQKYGGKFLVRGGAYETIEGDWQPHRFVIIEFDDVDHFKKWYHSPEYAGLRELRFKASTAQAIVIQGA